MNTLLEIAYFGITYNTVWQNARFIYQNIGLDLLRKTSLSVILSELGGRTLNIDIYI